MDNSTATPSPEASSGNEVLSGFIRFTLKELKQAEGAISKLASASLPLKAGFRVSRLLDRLMPEFEAVNKKINELVQKHGTPVKDGEGNVVKDRYTVPTEKEDAYTADLEELLSVELDVQFKPLTLDELGSASAITAGDFWALRKIIVE